VIEAIIQSKARIELLKLLLLDSDPRFYLRELVARSGLPQGSVQRELANLLEAGIVVREASGRQTYYTINERCPIVPDLRSLFVKTVGLADMLRGALSPGADSISCAFIYGSFARGDIRPESDVDVFVIGDITLRRLTTLLREVTSARPINPIAMPLSEFRSHVAEDDHFVTTVLQSPKVFLRGDENELSRLSQRQEH